MRGCGVGERFQTAEQRRLGRRVHLVEDVGERFPALTFQSRQQVFTLPAQSQLQFAPIGWASPPLDQPGGDEPLA